MLDGDDLSDAARSVWGKYGDGSLGWLPLWRHLADSAGVAARLWDHWLSPVVKNLVSRDLPDGHADGRRLVVLLAGIHDIGKATPAFAIQVPAMESKMRDRGFTFARSVRADRRLAPHATAGHMIVLDWLQRQYNWEQPAAETFAVVIGGHHGAPPTDADIKLVRDHPALTGDSALWLETQLELLQWMTNGSEAPLDRWHSIELSQPVQVVLTGIVIVADWIASNEEYFPYGPAEINDRLRVAKAWKDLDLPSPWRATPPTENHRRLFAERFSLPEGAQPYPIQLAVADAARSMPTPGLLIVEAPMGEGKTEAALAAVEILAARTGASGCLIALPTRATTNAMFGRVLPWLEALPDEDVGRGRHDIGLAHGKASLNREFSALLWKSAPTARDINDCGPGVAAHRWLAGRKRSLLASFCVATIDQLLFAALKSRHIQLRHLGLAGKIVVIDEAHAYDVYMSQYLDRALTWLAAYGVPVVVLSATLPAGRRADMMRAYDEGRFGAQIPVQSKPWLARPVAPDPYDGIRADRRYPLLTVSGENRTPTATTCASSSRALAVQVETHSDDPTGLAATLRDLLADGGCALVVANTVARVQETAAVLREELGPEIPVSVAHSRFIALDRETKDNWLRDTFGPPAHLAKKGTVRPLCHVVVASQVAEQSLDIDFDLLVTDVAPVDLMLQRIGRLHRHQRPRPPRLTEPICLVRGADWGQEPPKPVRGTVAVYGLAPVLRSAAVLWPYLSEQRQVAIPADIAPLVQDAYGGTNVGPQSWHHAVDDAVHRHHEQQERQRNRAMTFRIGPVQDGSLVGWLNADVGDVDSAAGDARGRAHVRDDGGENLEVLILVRRNDGCLVTPPWLTDSNGAIAVPEFADPDRKLSKLIVSCSLPLPRAMTSDDLDATIDELEKRSAFPAWQQNPWLAGELVLVLDELGQAELTNYTLTYGPDDGLRVTRSSL